MQSEACIILTVHYFSRSKLLRVGMVTPSDDLCSPAIAVNPRTTSGSDYQEVKGKGKKTKKNKMLKVDARILGFSVTAAEDRINVGDIDTVWAVVRHRSRVHYNSPCDNLSEI